jgi:hypothetical protein
VLDVEFHQTHCTVRDPVAREAASLAAVVRMKQSATSTGNRIFNYVHYWPFIWRSTVLKGVAGKSPFKLALPDAKQY